MITLHRGQDAHPHPNLLIADKILNISERNQNITYRLHVPEGTRLSFLMRGAPA